MVHQREARSAGPLVQVRVKPSIASIDNRLHSGTDGVAIDTGADVKVVDVSLIRHRTVAGQEDERIGCCRESAVEKAHTLSGVSVWAAQIAEHLLVEFPSQADSYGHTSARKRRATICVRLTFSFACQEKACQL